MLRVPGLFACLSLTCVVLVAQKPATSPSRVALPFTWTQGDKAVAVPAPSGKLILRAVGKRAEQSYPEDESELDYFIESDGRRLSSPIRAYISPHAMWSPSSDLLAVTSSDGGLVGSWKLFVYDVVRNRVVEHNVMKQVQADLARRYPSGINPPGLNFFSEAERADFARDVTWVNVLACRWIHEPERLLVDAPVPPSSRYGANMGNSIA